MTGLPGPLRRALGALVLGLPFLALAGPFPFLRYATLIALVLLGGALLLPAAGFQEDLAWQVVLTLLTPLAWMAADPGAWWTRVARSTEHPRLITGALAAGERWGSAEATYEAALVDLGSGIPAFQEAGYRRLQLPAARGHRGAQEAQAGCRAWGHGTPLDPAGARALWVRLGGDPEAPIPPPPLGLLRRAAGTPEGPGVRRIADGLEQAGAATRALLVRSPAARAGLWILAGTLLLFLLAIPLSFVASNLAQGGLVAQATGIIGFVVGIALLPAALMMLVMALLQRRSTTLDATTRRQLDRAAAGDPEAAYHRGLACDRGTPDTPRDVAEARRWFQIAADQGHLAASAHLGELLLLGLGGPRDREGARHHLRRAAEAGDALAARRLADLERHAADQP